MTTGVAVEEKKEEALEFKPSSNEETQEVDEAKVAAMPGSSAEARALSGTGFTYRHDWGNRRGQWRLFLNWGSVNANSRVFVAIAEGGTGTAKHMGAARYTLHNVVPYNNGVAVWVNIEWSSNIRLYVDYLVVNP